MIEPIKIGDAVIWQQMWDVTLPDKLHWAGVVTRTDRDYGIEIRVNNSYIWAHPQNVFHPEADTYHPHHDGLGRWYWQEGLTP